MVKGKNYSIKNVTILTGAGLTASQDFFGLTTLGLTEKFINYRHKDISENKKLVKYLYKAFCLKNNLEPKAHSKNLNQINFETILQIIEELHAYAEDIEKTELGAKFINSIKSTIYKLRPEIVEHVIKDRSYRAHKFYFFLEKLYNHLIDLTIKQLVKYNDDKANKGMNEFHTFLKIAFPEKDFAKRIYTLNYDNWLSKFGNYYDGFDGDTFNSLKVIQDREINCHYNLHGCILWDWLSHKKLIKPRITKHSQSGTEPTIAREALLPSPIISGYNKLTRIHSALYLEIFHSLLTDCVSSNRLLIIGYSFSDPHINDILRLTNPDCPVEIVVRYSADCLANPNDDIFRVFYVIAGIFNTNFTAPKIKPDTEQLIESDDLRISVFINGIGETFYQDYLRIKS